MRVSYIIHYRHTVEKLNLLRKTLEWLSGFSNIDIIIVEHDKYSKLAPLHLNAKLLFIKNTNNKIYNKSWAFNYALRFQKNPICVFSDCNIIMYPKLLADSLSEMANYDVIKPYKRVVKLTEQESNSDLNSITGVGEVSNLCSGVVIFKTESLLKIGGWCEMYETLGGDEDLFQEHKIKLLGLNYKVVDDRALNLYHSEDSIDSINKNKNNQYIQQLMQMDVNKMINYVNVSLSKIGYANKYS